MRYANHECAGCGLILPANELERVEDTVETGTSQTSRRVGHTSHFLHSSTTKHYAKRGKLLCGPCRIKRVLGKLVTGACGIGLLLAFMPRGGSNQTEPIAQIAESSPLPFSSDTGTEPSNAAPGESISSVDPDAPRSRFFGDDRKVADVTDRPPTSIPQLANEPMRGSDSATASDLAAQILAQPASVEEVHQAMLKAVETGEATRWHSGKVDGYAVPSTAASDRCRMVIVSIDGGASSAAERLCPAEATAL